MVNFQMESRPASERVYVALQALKDYVEKREYKGWDPYDGLNSRVFQATPLRRSELARLAWIQFFKLSPINLRKMLLVPEGHNSKGVALCLSAYCNLHHLARQGIADFGDEKQLERRIDALATLLVSLRSEGYSAACWGYNFDWQSRAFYLPRFTPTVVATAFGTDALLGAYEITNNETYLSVALSTADFVVENLNRIEKPDGLFMFSYSPFDHQAVYNATLLGTKILSRVYAYTKNENLKDLACKSASAVCRLQNSDGSFPHSDQVGQDWRDSFHTGFKLESLMAYQEHCLDDSFRENIARGFDYWLESFFDQQSGCAYYYDRGKSKDFVDLHCAAQAIVTFAKLRKDEEYQGLMEKIALWAIDNMQSDRGFFYFQKRGNRLNKVAYMRWPNAWMLYALSSYLVARGKP